MSHSCTNNSASGCCNRIFDAETCSRSALRPTRCTRAPSAVNPAAVAAPIPELPPVTTMSTGRANGCGIGRPPVLAQERTDGAVAGDDQLVEHPVGGGGDRREFVWRHGGFGTHIRRS